MISAIRMGLMRMATPVIRRAPVARIPFPAQTMTPLKLAQKTWRIRPRLTGAAAVVATLGTFGFMMSQRPDVEERAAGLKELKTLSHGLSNTDTLDDYMELAFKLQYEGDRKWMEEFWENVGKAFLKACESGDTVKVNRITSYIEVRDAKLPPVNLSRIPHDSLSEIVDRLLDSQVKKVTVEDFEWALLHKNYELYEILLRHLETERPREQLAVSKLAHGFEGWAFEHGFDPADKIYASYECLLEHPRIRPYREIARAYHDRHEQRLRERCQKEIIEIQELLNNFLETQLSVEELCQKSIDKTLEIESRERGTIVLAKAQNHMILLKQLLETNDTTSLHWLEVKRHFWQPPASGVAGWC